METAGHRMAEPKAGRMNVDRRRGMVIPTGPLTPRLAAGGHGTALVPLLALLIHESAFEHVEPDALRKVTP